MGMFILRASSDLASNTIMFLIDDGLLILVVYSLRIAFKLEANGRLLVLHFGEPALAKKGKG